MTDYRERVEQLLDYYRSDCDDNIIRDYNLDNILSAMCDLAEQIEKESKLAVLYKYTNLKHSDFLNFSNHSLALGQILGKMCKDIEELGINIDDIYTKEQVEKLLEKQRKLCLKNAKINYIFRNPYPNSTHTYSNVVEGGTIDKDSILNSKSDINNKNYK